MPIEKEKFDGLRENITAEKREYHCTYICRGVVNTNEFPSSFEWKCKNLSDPFARLISVESTRQLSAELHEMTAHYSTLPADSTQRESNRDQVPNPLARPVRRRWTTGYIETYPQRDLDNKAIVAANNEPIRGGIPIKVPYLVKHYTRNEAFFNEAAAMATIWAMNAAKTIVCTKFDGSEQLVDQQTNISYVEVTYEFWQAVGSNTWDERRMNAGSYWLEDGKPKYLEDAEGVKSYADGAILLKADGSQLPQGSSPNWLTFRTFRIANLASLGLPGIS